MSCDEGYREVGLRSYWFPNPYRSAHAQNVGFSFCISNKRVGFSLHANVKINGDEREKIEKLCRYTARPPVAAK